MTDAPTIDREAWATLLDNAGDPATWGEVRRAVVESDMLDPDDPGAVVDDALDSGVLVEYDDGGAFAVLALVESDDSDERDPTTDERANAHTGEQAGHKSDASTPSFRGLYERAAEQADRETWEFVEQSALHDVLDAAGFAHLLDSRALHGVNGWRFVDLSDNGEPADPRWYFASGDEPRPDEFRRFDRLLRAEAPDDYVPHYFRVAPAGKDPATQFGGWKRDEARLDTDEAAEWMEQGGNVGIAGRGECKICDGDGEHDGEACDRCDGSGDLDGPLVNVDIDDDEATTPDDVPTSLRARSRSRTGWHTWYFDQNGEIPNIPTDEYGEVRAAWQYVVAPGSFVASASEHLPDDADDPGYYTVEAAVPVAPIGYDDLPDVFHDAAEAAEQDVDDETNRDPVAIGGGDAGGVDTDDTDRDGASAVFDVEATDLVTGSRDASDRFSSIFHNSETGANMSVSGEDKLHCWRHNVAHGGLQALATLSRHCPYGCGDLGASHKNGGAGPNRLKGDWRLVWYAWREAKRRGVIPDDDPLPWRAMVGVAVDDGIVERDDLVERDGAGGGTYTGFPDAAAYDRALDHVRDEYDVDPGRDPTGQDLNSGDRDPRDVAVVLDPGRAWRAAGLVEPADLPDDHALATVDTDAGAAFACSGCGEPVDVVRAVALDLGLVETCDAPLADDYAEAYAAARDDHGAPLPRFVTAAEAVGDYDTVLGAVRELDFWHLDREALVADVTGEGSEVGGDAVLSLDPSPVDGWRDSDSGDSVVVYDSGVVYDADAGDGTGDDRGQSFDALRFVALDSGVLDDPTDAWGDGEFCETYRIAREVYGAPLPRWYAAEARDRDADRVPFVPAPDDLLGDGADALDTDGAGDLGEMYDAVGDLVRDATDPDTAGGLTVVSALPATGKTTAAIRQAVEQPTTYLAPRLDLQEQAGAKAERGGVSYDVLPVFSDGSVAEGAVELAVAHVREHGERALRERWRLVDAAGGDPLVDDDDSDDDDVDLDRVVCPTAAGENGAAWALAVATARRRGYRPREIHRDAVGLFGADLPCSCDDGDDAGTCPYSDRWDEINDRDEPADLLIGSYGHAYVEGVRTYRAGDRADPDDPPRAVVLDEYVGDAFATDFGPEAFGVAAWLAGALVDDVEARADVTTGLSDDDLLVAWLDGTITDEYPGVQAVQTTLRDRRIAVEAVAEARDLLDRYDDLDDLDLDDALADLVATWDDADGAPSAGDLRDAARALVDPVGAIRPTDSAAPIARWVVDDVLDPLLDLGDRLAPDPTALPVPADGALATVVDHALDTSATLGGGAVPALRAAERALDGGADGCRELSIWSDDGDAHPDAAHLLRGVITPTDADRATRVRTDSFNYPNPADAGDGSVLKQVALPGDVTVLVDENRQGATILDPPERHAAGGDTCPLVGLDATARPELWALALGARGDTDAVDVVDVHDGPRERAEFLRDHLGVTVAQMSARARPYSGDPDGKDTDGDVALVEHLSDTFAGAHGPRERGAEATVVGDPAVITSKGVEQLLDSDDRLDGKTSTFAHYGDLDGRNDLGEHRLAALLGSPHYGDHYVERVAALGGEQVDTSRETGRGMQLDYDSPLANAALRGMREDRVAQAILRFARGGSGAVVFARTAALRDDLPVRGEGRIAKTYTANATRIAEAAAGLDQDRDRFTTADVRERLGDDAPSARTIRRTLAEFATAGYVERDRHGEGTAYGYADATSPGAGEVETPAVGVDTHPDTPRNRVLYTASVRVVPPDRLLAGGEGGGSGLDPVLPAPGTAPDRAGVGVGHPE